MEVTGSMQNPLSEGGQTYQECFVVLHLSDKVPHYLSHIKFTHIIFIHFRSYLSRIYMQICLLVGFVQLIIDSWPFAFTWF